FSRYAAHRDLHSFPTRRSSDLAVIAIVVVATVSYRALTARREGDELVNETEALLADTAQLLSLVKDAETGQRGYLLTGDARYLADRKSTRLNSSHDQISYAVFC